jgi:hypothetical protein
MKALLRYVQWSPESYLKNKRYLRTIAFNTGKEFVYSDNVKKALYC